jgi:futalosine hydrolase
MHILIVSATHFEIKPLLDHLKIDNPVTVMNTAKNRANEHTIDVLITGIGMVNTAFMMGRYSSDAFDLILNVGVCGAFDRSVKLGSLLQVTEDVLSELGAEDGEAFLTYDKMNLPGKHHFHSQLNKSFPQIDALSKVKGITVNTVHGNDTSIERVKQLYAPDVESMEGAAFFAACDGTGKNYAQLRAISNYVEKRDKSKWQMPLAIKNLNDFLIEFIETIQPITNH